MKKDNTLIRKLYSDRTIKRIESKIKLLGINCKYNLVKLLSERLIISILLFVIILLINKNGYILAPLITLIFYIGSEYLVLDYQIKKRVKKLDNEALFFFEVLALTLESGRNLKGALDMTCDNIDSELSDEFKKTLAEVRMGKSMSEALNDMKSRIPSEAINNVLLNITQSAIFGNSIVESIYNQVDYLREKQLLEVKSEIGKMPVKISVISVLFFVPLMLLLILGPVLINFLVG